MKSIKFILITLFCFLGLNATASEYGKGICQAFNKFTGNYNYCGCGKNGRSYSQKPTNALDVACCFHDKCLAKNGHSIGTAHYACEEQFSGKLARIMLLYGSPLTMLPGVLSMTPLGRIGAMATTVQFYAKARMISTLFQEGGSKNNWTEASQKSPQNICNQ